VSALRPPLRYATLPFPRYRYRPADSPHPRRDPAGHSHGKPEPACAPFPPRAWSRSAEYLHGVDLFNHGYYWESHELFEALWNAFGRRTPEGRFFQGLLQIAAAHLKGAQGQERGARALARRGAANLGARSGRRFGLDVARFAAATRRYFEANRGRAPRIRLRMPGKPAPGRTKGAPRGARPSRKPRWGS